MNTEQFTQDATRTEKLIGGVKFDPVLLQQVCMMFIASGTLLDMIKKNIFYNKPIDSQKWDSSVCDAATLVSAVQRGSYTPLTVPQDINIDPRVFHAIVGMATESTELIEAMVKSITTNTPLDTVNVGEEVFDTMWYMAICADACGFTWDQIAETGIAKLRDRYPDKFTDERAVDRNVSSERDILESGLVGG